MKTTHRLASEDARELRSVADASVDLVVTSPPYPMVKMWDGVFADLCCGVEERLQSSDGHGAFDLMHAELDKVWRQLFRVVKPGGMVCINIGDATRTLAGDFALYSNHARVIHDLVGAGFTVLPDVLWHKPTNAPNKFLGSGMLPAGAYVTYEHEYVLMFRRGTKRQFLTAAAKANRRRSAFFWEERNLWFSDIWTDLRGVRQEVADPAVRSRSAAFPFELPYRLVQMFSVFGDTVLDPFLGLGTTCAAALASGRHSIGVEIDPSLRPLFVQTLERAPDLAAERLEARLEAHRSFVTEREAAAKPLGHANGTYGFPVVTRQEAELAFAWPLAVHRAGPDRFEAEHSFERPTRTRVIQTVLPWDELDH